MSIYLQNNNSHLMLEKSVERALLETGDMPESTTRKAARIVFTTTGIFLSFASEAPSIINASGFNLFPGAREISAGAVLVYAFFGAENVLTLSNILFDSPTDKCEFCAGKVVRISFSILLGIFSRLRGAGVALHVAPGIPQEFRLPLALLKLIGSASPEIVSVYNTLGVDCKRLIHMCTQDEQEKSLLLVRENLLKCLQAAKIRLLEDPQYLDEIKELGSAHDTKNLLNDLLDKIVQSKNLGFALEQESAQKQKRPYQIGLAGATSLGTTCSIALSTVLAKYADNSLFPGGDADWKWALAAISALAIAHTSYSSSFKGASGALDSLFSLCGSRLEKNIGKALYPKTHLLFSICSALLILSLFGDHYQTVRGSVGFSDGIGILLLIGIVFASSFLYFQGMQNLFDKTAKAFATSRFADERSREITKAYSVLEKVETVLTSTPIATFAESLQRALPQTSEEQKNILLQKCEYSLEELFSQLTIDEKTPLVKNQHPLSA